MKDVWRELAYIMDLITVIINWLAICLKKSYNSTFDMYVTGETEKIIILFSTISLISALIADQWQFFCLCTKYRIMNLILINFRLKTTRNLVFHCQVSSILPPEKLCLFIVMNWQQELAQTRCFIQHYCTTIISATVACQATVFEF